MWLSVYVMWCLICVTWLIHMRVITHSHVWHDGFLVVRSPLAHLRVVMWLSIYVMWLFISDAIILLDYLYVWHDSFTRVTWLIHMCDMTHSYACHDSFTCVAWWFLGSTQSPRAPACGYVIIYICNVIIYIWCDYLIKLSICVTWLIHTCDVTHSYVWHDSFIRVSWLIHTCAWWFLGMGWLQSIGSIKL